LASIEKSENREIGKMKMSHVVPRSTYALIYVGLMILTGLTTFVAFFDLGLANPVVALSIAVLKASLVVLFFMHMRWSSRLTMIIGGSALFWLGIMIVLTLSDYTTRGWAWF
jgi:cytochrome c oxidase subunit 4